MQDVYDFMAEAVLAGYPCMDCGDVQLEVEDARCADCRLERRNVRRGHAGEVVYVYEISSQEDDFNVY